MVENFNCNAHQELGIFQILKPMGVRIANYCIYYWHDLRIFLI